MSAHLLDHHSAQYIEYDHVDGTETELVCPLGEGAEVAILATIVAYEFFSICVFRKSAIRNVEPPSHLGFSKKVLKNERLSIPSKMLELASISTMEEACRYVNENSLTVSCENFEDGEFVLGKIKSASNVGIRMSIVSPCGEVADNDGEILYQDIDVINLFGSYERSIGRLVFQDLI